MMGNCAASTKECCYTICCNKGNNRNNNRHYYNENIGCVGNHGSTFYCGCQNLNKRMSSKGFLAGYKNGVSYGDEALEYDFETLHKIVEWADESPVLPFKHECLDPLGPDTTFFIDGKVNINAKSFTINFCTESDQKTDIAFHFNPRFDQNYVARNSRVDGKWGHEEAQSFRLTPFTRDAEFSIEIHVSQHEYLVAVNGGHFCIFKHRISSWTVRYIEIIGDITLSRVERTTRETYPTNITYNKLPITEGDVKCPIVAILPEKLKVGSEIILEGRVKLLPVSFYINLEEGGGRVHPHPRIFFHMSARFKEPSSGHCIVFNSWMNESKGWNTENVVPMGNTFIPGKKFKLSITCQEHHYIVSVNKLDHFYTFNYVTPTDLDCIDTIYLQGEILVSNLTVTS